MLSASAAAVAVCDVCSSSSVGSLTATLYQSQRRSTETSVQHKGS